LLVELAVDVQILVITMAAVAVAVLEAIGRLLLGSHRVAVQVLNPQLLLLLKRIQLLLAAAVLEPHLLLRVVMVELHLLLVFLLQGAAAAVRLLLTDVRVVAVAVAQVGMELQVVVERVHLAKVLQEVTGMLLGVNTPLVAAVAVRAVQGKQQQRVEALLPAV
jgi:hypothetical protein